MVTAMRLLFLFKVGWNPCFGKPLVDPDTGIEGYEERLFKLMLYQRFRDLHGAH